MGAMERRPRAATGRTGNAAQSSPPGGKVGMPDGDGGMKQRADLDPTTVQLVLKETKDLVRSLEGTGVRRVKV